MITIAIWFITVSSHAFLKRFLIVLSRFRDGSEAGNRLALNPGQKETKAREVI